MMRPHPDFTDVTVDLTVWDLKHLSAIISELRAKRGGQQGGAMLGLTGPAPPRLPIRALSMQSGDMWQFVAARSLTVTLPRTYCSNSTKDRQNPVHTETSAGAFQALRS